MTDEINELKEAEKQNNNYDDNDMEETTHRTPTRYSKNWSGGLILIGIGVIFLISNTTSFHLHNWWALFILIPAFSNLGNAVRNYQDNGRLTRSGRGSLTGAIILGFIASVFLFSLDWGIVWPIFLIIGGLSALLGGMFDR
jgi:hypothetical protein